MTNTSKLPAVRLASKVAVLSLIAVAGFAQAASAQDSSGSAVFTGSILDECTVVVLTPGVLNSNDNQSRLGSEAELAGVSATAEVVTNSPRSQIQVLPAVGFDVAPVGSELNTEFDTAYSLTGTTNADVEDGNTLTDLEVGLSTMLVDAGAEKTSGTFEGGEYTFTTTVRCITQ